MAEAVLASWNDGPARQAIVDFVTSATTPGPGFVAPADRIAAFDNDGTLWVEQPLPPQFDFVFRRWGEEIKADPSLAEKQPYKAIIDEGPGVLQGVATQDPEVVGSLLDAFGRSWAGTTPAEFDAQVREWLATVKQPKLGVLVPGAGLPADARAVRPASRPTSSGCSCAPAAAATSCASSPRRPGGSSRRT